MLAARAEIAWEAQPRQSFKVGFPVGTSSVTLQPGTEYPVVWEKAEEWYVTVEINGQRRNVLVPKSAAAQVSEEQLTVSEPLTIDATQQYVILSESARYPVLEKEEASLAIQLPADSPKATSVFPLKYFHLTAIIQSEDQDSQPTDAPDDLQARWDELRKLHARKSIGTAKKPEDYVCLIVGKNGSGTGFLMRDGDNVYCYTAFHIVDGLQDLEIFKMDGEQLTPLTLEAANYRDVARMLIADAPVALPGFRIAEIGEALTVYGNSQGRYRITQLKGKVTGVGNNEIETNAEFTSGNSGSALVADKDGYAIGVASYIESVTPPDDLAVRQTQFAKPRRVGEALDDSIDWIPADLRRLRSANRKYHEHLAFVAESIAVLQRMAEKPFNPITNEGISDLGLKRWIAYFNRSITQARQYAHNLQPTQKDLEAYDRMIVAMYKDQFERFNQLSRSREAQIRALRNYPGTEFQKELNLRLLAEIENINQAMDIGVRHLGNSTPSY